MFEKITANKTYPHFILKKFFGYSEFREGQLEIINNILDKKDTLAILPTGGGKSICFQVPALIFSQKKLWNPRAQNHHSKNSFPNKYTSKVSIVISPLISLMKDQVDSLNSKGIPACYINSSLSQTKQRETQELIKLGKVKIIYVSPERLKSKKFIGLIKKINIGMIIVDEAHCISQWGNDFRPQYKQISDFYKYINKDVVKVAFTATANKKVQKDICETLKLKKPSIFFKSFSRDNLFLEVIECKTESIKNLSLLRILNLHKNQTGIIYCATRKTTQHLVWFLKRYGISATYYHGAIEKKEKEMIQNSFINGNTKLIIATNAFGMGIDKSDIRFVVHYEIPGNIESYYQEVGRAGRDGKPSSCYCLYYENDIKIQMSFVKKRTKQKEANLEKLKKMYEFLQTKNCRTNIILNYFGEIKHQGCNNCDNCLKQSLPRHPLLTKISPEEVIIMKKLLKQKHKYKKPTNFLTDKEICYLSITKPKNKIDCMNIPGLGKGWTDTWWETVEPIINNSGKI